MTDQPETTRICDCELGHNGFGMAIRECDCDERKAAMAEQHQSTETPGAEDFVAAACFYMERLDWRRALRDLELAVADLKERLADG